MAYTNGELNEIQAGVFEQGEPVHTSVSSSTTPAELLSANSRRKDAEIFNDSTAVAYVAEFPNSVAPVSAAVKSYAIAPGCLAVVEGYRGSIQIVWASQNGFANVTEHQYAH